MADLGDFLELLHGASSSYETFRGEFRVEEHPEVVRQALKALREDGPRRSRIHGRGLISRSSSFLIGGDPDAEESNAPEQSSVRLWIERPDRLREEEGEGEDIDLVVRDGERWWTYSPLLGSQSNGDEDESSRSTVTGSYESLLDPVELLSRLLFEPLGRGERSGRLVYRARGRPRVRPDSFQRRASWALGAGADEYELELDAERGVILRLESRFAGQQLSVIEAVRVAFDEPLAADTFVFVSPDGRPPAPDDDRDSQHVSVREAAGLAPFPVFVLAEMPQSWASFATFSPARERPSRPAEVTLVYVAADGGGTVSVRQRVHDESSASRWEKQPAERQVIRDGRSITVVEMVPGVNVARVVLENTQTQISSSDLDTEQLVDLATRLRPAPASPPTI